MGMRVLISGVQLGMLIGLARRREREKLVDEIVDKQWLWDSDGKTMVKDDAKELRDRRR